MAKLGVFTGCRGGVEALNRKLGAGQRRINNLRVVLLRAKGGSTDPTSRSPIPRRFFIVRLARSV